MRIGPKMGHTDNSKQTGKHHFYLPWNWKWEVLHCTKAAFFRRHQQLLHLWGIREEITAYVPGTPCIKRASHQQPGMMTAIVAPLAQGPLPPSPPSDTLTTRWCSPGFRATTATTRSPSGECYPSDVNLLMCCAAHSGGAGMCPLWHLTICTWMEIPWWRHISQRLSPLPRLHAATNHVSKLLSAKFADVVSVRFRTQASSPHSSTHVRTCANIKNDQRPLWGVNMFGAIVPDHLIMTRPSGSWARLLFFPSSFPQRCYTCW